MKRCPFCAEEIQDAAVVCKHCNRQLGAIPSATPVVPEKKPTSKIVKYGGGFLGLMLLMGYCASLMNPQPTSAPAAARSNVPSSAGLAPAAPQLQLLSSRGGVSDSDSFNNVEGEVKNISNESLKNVSVVATWYDENGGFIKSDDALIDYNPILPGQTSPFKSITSRNPAMAKYAVSFKFLFGREIAVEDARKK